VVVQCLFFPLVQQRTQRTEESNGKGVYEEKKSYYQEEEEADTCAAVDYTKAIKITT
jgi:hypothetical protein